RGGQHGRADLQSFQNREAKILGKRWQTKKICPLKIGPLCVPPNLAEPIDSQRRADLAGQSFQFVHIGRIAAADNNEPDVFQLSVRLRQRLEQQVKALFWVNARKEQEDFFVWSPAEAFPRSDIIRSSSVQQTKRDGVAA